MIVAVDLDGVIVPDMFNVADCSEDEMKKFREQCVPIFTPPKDWVIVTGRPIQDKEHTIEVLRNFGFENDIVFANNSNDILDDFDMAYQKVISLSGKGVNLYIESSRNIAHYIDQITMGGLNCVLFSDWLLDKFENEKWAEYE